MYSRPVSELPNEDWPFLQLYRDVREAIYSLPACFKSETYIEGINVTDIFTLSSALGATIENQVVEALNQMRGIWDPDGDFALYRFVRQSQTFPDVRLARAVNDTTQNINRPETIMGIELKGWYLLAKEGEPSFRFKVTPAACALQDLIVVVPWSLSNVISGSPRVFTPYVESARYAAEYRNYWWTSIREAQGNKKIIHPEGAKPYPKKSNAISDEPRADAGGNFGRYSRTGLMDEYLALASAEAICGIRADHWRAFFKLFQDQKDEFVILEQITSMRKKISVIPDDESELKAPLRAILEAIEAIAANKS